MAILLSTPATPHTIGPGYRLTVLNTAVGPFPVDDLVIVNLFDGAGGGNVFLTAQERNGGFGNVALILGVLKPASRFTTFLTNQLAAGAAVSAEAFWYHSNGTLVGNTGVIGGYTWDPSTGLATLLSEAIAALTDFTSDTAAILAAVTTTFPRTT